MNRIHYHIKKFALLLSGLVFISTYTNAQVSGDIKAGFDKYSKTILQEKIYAHTDRVVYMTGEILWFKLYNVDAGLNTRLDISKVAYVDVLDADNNAVLQAKVALKKGLGNGSIYIPVSMANGNYKLRAYTNWMKNFSPELYFEKQITIVDPLRTPLAPVKQVKVDHDIQFFPEGGNLVNGIASTVGFKITGEDGNGIYINGVVINQRNDTVARFWSSDRGIGRFTFTPVAGATYKAVLRAGANNALIKQLPQAMPGGYVISVSEDETHQQVQVKISGTTGGEDLYLLSHSGATVTTAQIVRLGDGNTQAVTISKSKLGDGINHITLFNAAKQPVCERLYFKRPALLDLQAALQPQYQTRKKVIVNIAAKGSSNQPQQANLSVAVYRADSLNGKSGADIASYLWLTSELKGHIENPAYYFTNVTPNTDVALDNLLLTQGWSRFKWDDVLSRKPAALRFLPEYNGHLITGKITDAGGAPANHMLVYLAVPGKRIQVYGAASNIAGQLTFNTRDLFGANEIILQNNTELDSNTYHITVNSPFSEQYSATKLTPFYISSKTGRQLADNSLGMQVQNLYKPENLRQYYSNGVDSSAFYDKQYRIYLLENYTRFTTMEEVLREYIKEVNVVKQKQRFHIKVIGGKQGFFLEGDPLVLVDGVPVFNLDKVFTIDPLKIKRLDVVNQEYFWGPISSSGILAFSSYKTDMGGHELDPRTVVLDYEGLQLQREFYSPVYETPAQQKSRLPDFRNLLYWSPDVNTGNDGKAQATFYTSDKAGKYIGVIQGIGTNGQAGGQYFIFDVK